ncbi:MAG: hypothetical protein ACK4TD_18325 [Ectopseudomonas guguanensis]|uniref:hypothetical protein n=1 Tax=Ectopseudomonas guguanensis TaxID=1198456 RepID=UPI00391C3EE2
MTQLTVHLDYMSANVGGEYQPDGDLLLPVKALDDEGSILAEGATQVGKPAILDLPVNTPRAFVRLIWPSGRTETQRIALDGQRRAELTFSDNTIAPATWSAWAIPRLNVRTPLVKAQGDLDLDLGRFNRVWLRLWRHERGVWTQKPLRPDETYRNGAAWQLDLTLDSAPWLLQLGGSNVPWRFVSLPGKSRARVLLTPKDSHRKRSDPLTVVVTSFRPAAETLLEFLSRDSMRAADTLVQSARHLFAEKFEDPVSAVAGAYYLLRRGDWQGVPLYWFRNLSRHFPWIPDTHLLYCVRLLREGTSGDSADETAVDLFVSSLTQGWPIYEEGITLLQEAASVLRPALISQHSGLVEQVQALVAARAWTGAVTSFHGKRPDTPSLVQWVGMPHAPRRRKLTPALTATSHERGGDQGWRQLADTPHRYNLATYIAEKRLFRELTLPSPEKDRNVADKSPPRTIKSSRSAARKTTSIKRNDEVFMLGNITVS